MSAQVTVHRMTTTTTTTAVLLNIGYLRTLPGILKLFQIVLGIVAVGITGHYIKWDSTYYENMVPELFFLLVATTCLITTTLLLLSCLCSIATASIIPKTLFETLYHVVAVLLYLSAGLCFIIYLNSDQNRRYVTNYGPKTAAAVSLMYGSLSYLLLYSTAYKLMKLVSRNVGYNIYERGYDQKAFCGAIGLVNTGLYLFSCFYSIRSYRRG